MTMLAKRLRLPFVVAFTAAIVAATSRSAPTVTAAVTSSHGLVMQLGHGLGPYRIGNKRRPLPGLIRTVRHTENDRGGCSGMFALDSYVDIYPGLRLGYIYSFTGGTYLDVIATSRRGDRTSLGFVIGRSSLAQVQRRYPHVHLARHLGGSTLSLYHRKGEELGDFLTYSFNANGRLVGLMTGEAGC